ncbi:MAG: type II toxin-antitoxin system RelE/ParE family toxin [Alphaproteobacteria bacterium]|nr:type II toxin-antitoxin system RelE/ParE family toxin [Alphaproteobacteria bacterium]
MPIRRNNYRLSPRAEGDLEEIWLYTYSTWSLEQADQYHDEIMTAIAVLASAPGLGQMLDHIRPGYRRYRSGSHFIFYRQVSDGGIEIIRILHQQMDFGSHL